MILLATTPRLYSASVIGLSLALPLPVRNISTGVFVVGQNEIVTVNPWPTSAVTLGRRFGTLRDKFSDAGIPADPLNVWLLKL